MRKIILASKSFGRKEVMETFGIDYEAVDSGYEEKCISTEPRELVKEHAIGKARATAENYEDAIIIAADTVAVFENQILGKPADEQGAIEMLKKLSGETHKMLTALCMIDTKTNQELIDIEESSVKFKQLSEEEIKAYVETGEVLGKAGAYAIQGKGKEFVESTEGDYYNIMGLPLAKVSENLKKLGVSVI